MTGAWSRPGVVVGAAMATAFFVLVTRHIPVGADERPLDLVGYLVLVAAGASVALSRWWPRSTVALVAVVLSVYVLRDYAGGPVFVAGWVVLFGLRQRTDRRTAYTGAALLSALLVAAGVLDKGRIAPVALVFVGWSLAAVFLGDALANRRSYLVELEERARNLERTREEEARRRVAEDRLRIAQDLHDSVAHAMATINVQAGAAAHVVDRRPEAAEEALAAIRRASGEVLDELGAMLTLLRADGDAADRAPTPGLDGVADLVATSRANGLDVSCDVRGPTDAVPAPMGTAAYRIVQESLTNVLRHAPGAATRVTVTAGTAGALAVEVVDDGAGRPALGSGTGMGVRGMRERAETTGGRLNAGPVPGGGFAVRAEWGPRP